MVNYLKGFTTSALLFCSVFIFMGAQFGGSQHFGDIIANSVTITDKKVNEVTPKLFSIANTPEKMAELSTDTIQEIIKEIGLAPTKAKNLHKMALQLIEGGGVKQDWDYLESLAGVGHKTASVVMSQWYGVPAFPVDTHIHRLAYRWGLSNGKNVVQTEEDLKGLFPKKYWNKLHLQIIYYGREFCKARDCYGITCKICTSCYPNRKKPVKTKKA